MIVWIETLFKLEKDAEEVPGGGDGLEKKDAGK